MTIVLLIQLLAPVGTPPTHVDLHPPLWHWIEAAPVIRSGLLSGQSHYYQLSETRIVSCDDELSSIESPRIVGSPKIFGGIDDALTKHGTAFEAGPAGPERFRVVYDPTHRLLRYHHGCCSYGEEVLVSDVGPPPQRVAHSDLTTIVTRRGLKLGDTRADVGAVYGKAKAVVVGRDGYTAFFYSRVIHRPCVQDSTFVFLGDRLVAISFWNGC
jgi:hypothetical protein